MTTRGHHGLLLGAGGGSAPTNAFSTAIAATSPMFWFRMNETSGSTAFNSGSAGNGAYSGSISYNQGALVAGESASSSILFDSTGEVLRIPAAVIAASGIADADWKGYFMWLYKGTMNGNLTPRLFGRQASGNLYVRGDAGVNIQVRTGAAAQATTSTASSILKDNAPHMIMLTKCSDGVTHDNVKLWADHTKIFDNNQTITVNSNEFQLANNYNNSEYTYGQYSEFVWSRGNYSEAQMAAIRAAWSP